MQFVDKQNDLALRVGHFFQESFEAIFEFSTVLGASDHCADVHRNDALIFQRIRNVTADDAPGQAFRDRCFTDTRIANEHRIIFCPAQKHLHHTSNFVVASDYRINLAAARQLGEIASIFFEGLKLSFWILIGHAL